MKSNKKRILFVLAILTMALVLSCALVACNKTDSPDAPKKEFTITFDTQGGSEVKPITIAEGTTITLPRNPTKEGYIFDGWYLSDEFIEKFNATQTISSNITVYAKWKEDGNQDEKQSYTITFDTQGGSEVKQLVLKEGETLTLPSNPTKEGSVFDGWYLDSSYTQAFDSTKRIDSNMVLYAKWKILDEGQSIIASDYFDINGLVLTMNKKNYIESTEDVFDLRNKFSTSTGSSWRAFTSPNCDQPTEITTRMANVSVGWNDIYVMVENLTTYENQIYRLKIYKYPTIVYRELNDGFLEIQSVSDCADVLFPDDKINNITSIGKNAFSSCPSLRTLQNLPKLTNIGTSAFANCKRLTSITIPGSVTSIGNSAFSGCTGLTSITIPNSVTSIGEGAFSGCSSLESITIPFVGAKAGVTSSDTHQYPFGYIFGTSSYTGGVATKQYYYGSSTYSTTSTTYYIPSSLKSVTVTGGNILRGAFYHCSGLTSVIIGNSVTSIGYRAFYNCTGLTSVTIGNGVTSIGDESFRGCTGLTTVNWNATACTSAGSSNYPIFKDCSNLAKVNIGDNVKIIPSYAFYKCTGLTSVTIGNSVTSIGDYAFSNTAWYNNQPGGLVYAGKVAYKYKGTMPSNTSVVLREGTLGIADEAFYGCTGLTSVTIPNSVTSIGDEAFRNCKGLTSVTIPDSVTSIGYDAFRDCKGLTSVTIGDSVTSIGYGAFYGCTGLMSITIPDSVTSIGVNAFYDTAWYNKKPDGLVYAGKVAYKYKGTMPSNTSIVLREGTLGIADKAFYNCSGLTSITIPNSVTSIGERAFYGCTGLTSILVADGNSKYHSSGNCLIETASKTLISGCKTSVIPSDGSVTSIDSDAFSGCSGLTSITIPDSVTSIGDSAFSGCSSLTSITIPDSVTSIGGSAFRGCTGLTSVIIPNSVTSIGKYAFYKCTGLTSVTIGNSVTNIDGYAFYGCTGLMSITIPDSVTSIGGSAFEGCTGLTSITIPNSVTSIGNSAFEGCTGLTSITIPNSVTSIGNSAFEGCTGLMSITIPDSVTSIGNSAFEGCTGLTSVTIPNSVTIIGGSAFYGCTGLTSITIPNSVTSIGYSAFYNTAWYDNKPDGLVYAGKVAYKYKGTMPSYTTIELKEGTLGIGEGAFWGCTGLIAIVIPNSVTSIGDDAFGDFGLMSITVAKGNTKYHSAGNCLIETESKTLIVGCKNSIIPTDGSVTSIGHMAFSGCWTLTSITIPDSVTSIGGSAFRGCTGLTSITGSATNVSTVAKQAEPTSFTVNITSGTSIGNSAFYGCSGLTSITIPDSVTSIGNDAFYNTLWYNNQPNGLVYAGKVAYKYKGTMPSNTSIVLKEGTLGIADSAFYGCTGLTSVTIPDSVTSIGSYAFYGCTGLTSVTIPDSVTSIGSSAFSGCSGLTSITIPDSVTSIGSSAFSGCSGLTSITIPDSVTSIGDYAFKGCTGLTNVTIGSGVTSIGSYTFENCTGLTNVTIGGSVTRIGYWAFSGCNSLTRITFKGTIKQWNAISKGSFWKYSVPATQVGCTDGTISIE